MSDTQYKLVMELFKDVKTYKPSPEEALQNLINAKILTKKGRLKAPYAPVKKKLSR